MGCAGSRDTTVETAVKVPTGNSNTAGETSDKTSPPKDITASTPAIRQPELVSEEGGINFKPIHSAIRWNNKPLEEIEALLVNEEAVNCVDASNGNAPIHIASQNGHLDIVRLLIAKKANLNAQNMKGNTAIHMAVGYDYYEVSTALIDAGADPEMKNELGFIARTGLEGDKTLGVAALVCAKNATDVENAFRMCEERFDEVNKAIFVQSGMKTKKSLGEEWTTELNTKFREITQKLP